MGCEREKEVSFTISFAKWPQEPVCVKAHAFQISHLGTTGPATCTCQGLHLRQLVRSTAGSGTHTLQYGMRVTQACDHRPALEILAIPLTP